MSRSAGLSGGAHATFDRDPTYFYSGSDSVYCENIPIFTAARRSGSGRFLKFRLSASQPRSSWICHVGGQRLTAFTISETKQEDWIKGC